MLLTDTGLESERRARALSTLTCRSCGAGLEDEWLECPYCLTRSELSGMDLLIEDLMQELVKEGGSDLHLAAGDPPYGRFSGQLRPMLQDTSSPRRAATN